MISIFVSQAYNDPISEYYLRFFDSAEHSGKRDRLEKNNTLISWVYTIEWCIFGVWIIESIRLARMRNWIFEFALNNDALCHNSHLL